MNSTDTKRSLSAFAVAATLVAAPVLAHADDDAPGNNRRETLAEQPAVRHRLLLVAKRLEATPMFESTINADFRHFVGGGIKLEYHVNDMLSFGGIGVFSAALDTKLTTRVIDTLEADPDDATREPSQDEFAQHLNKMPLHGSVNSTTPAAARPGHRMRPRP